MQKAFEIAVALARAFEGYRAKPYYCPAGVPTIGYGTTVYPGGVKVSMKDAAISQEVAHELLAVDVRSSLLSAIRYCPILITEEEKLGAITDFVYNLGPGRLQLSTLRRRINEGNWPDSKTELMRWVRGGGRVLPGLVRRRAAEAAYF